MRPGEKYSDYLNRRSQTLRSLGLPEDDANLEKFDLLDVLGRDIDAGTMSQTLQDIYGPDVKLGPPKDPNKGVPMSTSGAPSAMGVLQDVLTHPSKLLPGSEKLDMLEKIVGYDIRVLGPDTVAGILEHVPGGSSVIEQQRTVPKDRRGVAGVVAGVLPSKLEIVEPVAPGSAPTATEDPLLYVFRLLNVPGAVLGASAQTFGELATGARETTGNIQKEYLQNLAEWQGGGKGFADVGENVGKLIEGTDNPAIQGLTKGLSNAAAGPIVGKILRDQYGVTPERLLTDVLTGGGAEMIRGAKGYLAPETLQDRIKDPTLANALWSVGLGLDFVTPSTAEAATMLARFRSPDPAKLAGPPAPTSRTNPKALEIDDARDIPYGDFEFSSRREMGKPPTYDGTLSKAYLIRRAPTAKDFKQGETIIQVDQAPSPGGNVVGIEYKLDPETGLPRAHAVVTQIRDPESLARQMALTPDPLYGPRRSPEQERMEDILRAYRPPGKGGLVAVPDEADMTREVEKLRKLVTSTMTDINSKLTMAQVNESADLALKRSLATHRERQAAAAQVKELQAARSRALAAGDADTWARIDRELELPVRRLKDLDDRIKQQSEVLLQTQAYQKKRAQQLVDAQRALKALEDELEVIRGTPRGQEILQTGRSKEIESLSRFAEETRSGAGDLLKGRVETRLNIDDMRTRRKIAELARAEEEAISGRGTFVRRAGSETEDAKNAAAAIRKTYEDGLAAIPSRWKVAVKGKGDEGVARAFKEVVEALQFGESRVGKTRADRAPVSLDVSPEDDLPKILMNEYEVGTRRPRPTWEIPEHVAMDTLRMTVADNMVHQVVSQAAREGRILIGGKKLDDFLAEPALERVTRDQVLDAIADGIRTKVDDLMDQRSMMGVSTQGKAADEIIGATMGAVDEAMEMALQRGFFQVKLDGGDLPLPAVTGLREILRTPDVRAETLSRTYFDMAAELVKLRALDELTQVGAVETARWVARLDQIWPGQNAGRALAKAVSDYGLNHQVPSFGLQQIVQAVASRVQRRYVDVLRIFEDEGILFDHINSGLRMMADAEDEVLLSSIRHNTRGIREEIEQGLVLDDIFVTRDVPVGRSLARAAGTRRKIKEAKARSFLELILRQDAEDMIPMWRTLNTFLASHGQILRTHMLGGGLLPNPRYLNMNFMTQPLIVYQTLGSKAALGSMTNLPVGFKVMAHLSPKGAINKVIPSPDLARPAVVAPDGTVYTLEDLAELSLRGNLGSTQATFELTGDVLERMKAAIKTDRSFVERLGDQLGLGPDLNFWNQLAADIDQAGRISVLAHALAQGDSPGVALAKAKRSLFDFDTLTEVEKNYLSKTVFFYSFMRHNLVSAIKNMASPKGQTRLKNMLLLTYDEPTPGEATDTDMSSTRMRIRGLRSEVSPEYIMYGPAVPAVDAMRQLVETATLAFFAWTTAASGGRRVVDKIVGDDRQGDFDQNLNTTLEQGLDIVSDYGVNPYMQVAGEAFGADLRNRRAAPNRPDPKLIGTLRQIPGYWPIWRDFIGVREDVPWMRGSHPDPSKKGFVDDPREANSWIFRDDASRTRYMIFQRLLGDTILAGAVPVAGRAPRDYSYATDPRLSLPEGIVSAVGATTPIRTNRLYDIYTRRLSRDSKRDRTK
jgi:hypothetical protein